MNISLSGELLFPDYAGPLKPWDMTWSQSTQKNRGLFRIDSTKKGVTDCKQRFHAANPNHTLRIYCDMMYEYCNVLYKHFILRQIRGLPRKPVLSAQVSNLASQEGCLPEISKDGEKPQFGKKNPDLWWQTQGKSSGCRPSLDEAPGKSGRLRLGGDGLSCNKLIEKQLVWYLFVDKAAKVFTVFVNTRDREEVSQMVYGNG